MEIKYNLWSFLLSLFVIALSFQALYATYTHSWSLAPPASVLWLRTVMTFFMGISGFRDKSSRRARWRSWLTVSITFPLSVIFLLGIIVNTFAMEHISTSHLPDSKMTIHFYKLNGGATSSISVVGAIDGPLWFKKNIYLEDPIQEADAIWTNNHIISINSHILNLDKRETFFD